MDALRSTLVDLGLSDKEIACYLMLLQLGTTTASIIGERTNIQRSTAQYTCQQLAKKGIVSMVQKGNSYLFTPDAPEKLIFLLRKQQDELAEKEERVQRIIGTLKGMLNPHSVLPKVRFYEGRDGIESAYQDVLKEVGESKEILSIVQPLEEKDDVLHLLPVVGQFVERRKKIGISTRVIAPRTPMGKIIQDNDAASLRETTLVPQEDFPSSATEILLYTNTVYMMTTERGSAFAAILQNAHISQLFRASFELLWKAYNERDRQA